MEERGHNIGLAQVSSGQSNINIACIGLRLQQSLNMMVRMDGVVYLFVHNIVWSLHLRRGVISNPKNPFGNLKDTSKKILRF